MNCQECKELFVGYLEGMLDAQQTSAVEAHLKACESCQKELEVTKALRQRLVANGATYAAPDLENTVMNGIVRKQAFELRRTSEEEQHWNFWRLAMKNRLAQLAAAAVIVAAVIVGIYHFAGGGAKPCLAWECIIRPIIDARTAEFDIVIGEEGAAPVIHDMVMGSRIRRTLEGIPQASIIDLSSSRILTLMSGEKKAMLIELKGLPNIPDYMDVLRNLVAKIDQDPNFTLQELGEQDVENQKLYGFRAVCPRLDLTIWVDPVTALPVRIEQQEGQVRTICKNMHFDVPMDESLFSMDIPDGYTLQESQLSTEASEADFIEMLRVQAQVLGDGVFSDDISVEYFVKQAPMMGQKLSSLGLSEQEQKEVGMKLTQGLMFIRFFKGQGEWHYAGKGVKLGDAATPIFWYQPKDSQTWRVIYGDLSVRDVAPENLPQ